MCTSVSQVDADLWGTAKFVDSVRLPYIAPSLGGVDSLIEQPTVISYWDQVRAFFGLSSFVNALCRVDKLGQSLVTGANPHHLCELVKGPHTLPAFQNTLHSLSQRALEATRCDRVPAQA
jgi:hypothetical protein